MIIKHSKLFKIYYLIFEIVDGTRLWREREPAGEHAFRAHSSHSPVPITVFAIAERCPWTVPAHPSRCAKPTRHPGRARPLRAKKPRHQTPRHRGITEEEAFITTERMGSYPWNGRI